MKRQVVIAGSFSSDFWKKSTWKTRNVGENELKRIPSTFLKFGRLFLDSGDWKETSIIGRLPKESGDLGPYEKSILT